MMATASFRHTVSFQRKIGHALGCPTSSKHPSFPCVSGLVRSAQALLRSGQGFQHAVQTLNGLFNILVGQQRADIQMHGTAK